MFEKLQTLFRPKTADRLKISTPAATTLAPVVVIACGAGMAFWWWSQWARNREETGAAEAKAALGEDQVTEISDRDAPNGLDESLAVQGDAANVVANRR